MDEIETHLGMRATPIGWPLYDGAAFKGVYDRDSGDVHLFEAEEHGATAIGALVGQLDDPAIVARLTPKTRARLAEELELLDVAGDPFDRERILAGKLTPMFFGSALTNFGVELFLKRFLAMAPTPINYPSVGVPITPDSVEFSGFVFKIQANMDKSHRDRIAFVRVCSGRFGKGMEVHHARLGKLVRLKNPSSFMARERSTIEEAYAGDIIGLYDPGIFRIGDTLSSVPGVRFAGIPHFSPEHFRRIRVGEPLKRKQLARGLEQLAEEGAIQIFADYVTGQLDIVGAVGTLQFDVLIHRLETEYSVKAITSPEPYTLCRWVIGPHFDPRTFKRGQGTICAKDTDGHPVVLFPNEWSLRWAQDNNKGFQLNPVSPTVAHAGDL
jgi:peptide chain release factor 3